MHKHTLNVTTTSAVANLYRDRDPEARALGGWYVELDAYVTKYSTDYYRSPHAAMAAALELAYGLGLTVEVK